MASGSRLGAEVASEETTTSTSAVGVADTPGLLYLTQSDAAVVTPIGSSGSMQVSLTGADAEVLWFQDRPGRAAGHIRTSELVDTWSQLGFAEDPPNAVIRHAGSTDAAGQEALGLVVEMSDPVWDQPNATLRFRATPAAGVELPGLMDDVALFIDDSGSGTSVQPVTLTVSNVAAGQDVVVDVRPVGGGDAGWSMAPEGQDGAVGMQAPSGPVSLTALELAPESVTVRTGGAGGAASSLTLTLYLETSGVSEVELTSGSGSGVEVTAAIGGQAPSVVNTSPTMFSLGG